MAQTPELPPGSVFDNLVRIFTVDGMTETIVMFVVVLVVRSGVVAALKRNSEVLSESRRRWISLVQNSSIAILFFGILVIWSPQLSALALSLAAFAVAIVIALKEMILSVVGAVYRASAKPFEIGDWIELGTIRGEVLEERLLSTRLLELGEAGQAHIYTGRVLVLPNSRLFTDMVINETFRKKYRHHSFAITLAAGTRPAPLRHLILETLDQHLAPSRDLAQRYYAMVRRKTQTNLAPMETRIHVHTSNLAMVVLTVTVFCSTDEATALENRITETVLEYVGETASHTVPDPAD